MPLSSGTKLGPYEIVGAVGAGGMGEVYRARDSRLDRTVAIKVLPSHHSSDSALRQRFEREARTISKFSHPNICTLHDIGTHDGVDYLVMEYIEGETLEQRLSKGPLSPQQALTYAIQIADALDKAHRNGIVHRDLKPGNVMLTKSGAKLLDFGLAKLQEEVSVMAAALTEMTVEAKRLTTEGMLVGTFQYMSPEQIEGKPPDARSDIFAFGAVLYEMLSGKPAFGGRTKASMIAAILSSEPPPLSTVQPLAPPALERVIKQCLAKDPDERWQNAGDVARELKWIAEGGSQSSVALPSIQRQGKREYLAWGVAAVGAMLAIVFGSLFVAHSGQPKQVIRSLILPEENTTPLITQDNAGPAVLAPDGSALAYVAMDSHGQILLWVRKLNETHARPLPGTDGAGFQFWSADNRQIGFFSGGKLKATGLEGGTYTSLEHGYQNIHRKSSSGMGQPELLLEGNANSLQNWPNDLSPDGNSLLYSVGDLVGAAQLWELPLSGNDRKPRPILPSNFMMMEARYSPDGRWIAYASNESSRLEVYVIPSNGSGGKWQVSNGGGQHPVWRRDGKELFYLSPDDKLMSVPIKLNPDSVQADAAQPLFSVANSISTISGLVAPYDVSPDGKRFIVVTVEQGKTFPINLVTNWTATLQK